MARIIINSSQLRQIESDLAHIHGGLSQALRLAIWDTTKQIKTDASKRIRDKVNIKKRDIDRHISLQRPQVVSGRPVGKMSLSSSDRLPLKYFGARKVSKGIRYKIDKAGAAVTAKDLFFVQSISSDVFARHPSSKVKKRKKKLKRSMAIGAKRKTKWMWPQLPIRKPLGVSPYGVVKKNELEQPIAAAGSEFFSNNLNRRVNFLILKQQNKLSWQTPSSN